MLRQASTLAAALMLVLAPAVASADVVKPYLAVDNLAGDTGVAKSGSLLTMDGTAFTLITTGAPIDIADEPFALAATFVSDDGFGSYTFGSGTLNIGTLLAATFSSLTVESLGFGVGNFFADLTYTGGSMKGSYTNGRVEGSFFGATTDNFSGNFTAADLTAVAVGQVQPVPVPAAGWLLGSALLGLAGLGRRRQAS